MLASTPADFWRRYNRPVQQFFHEHVFLPTGGRRSPARATLLVFVISAVVHEYVFGIILGRVQGFQAAFFLIQGLAVIVTLRARPTGGMKWIGRAATLAFNLVTSVLFFASLNQFLPFYSRPLPWPLSGW
jgi:D-alanyl-lipoteichoic acid acyltransferase DltB (MBOAT superfamily)